MPSNRRNCDFWAIWWLDTFHAFSIVSIATYVFHRYINHSLSILNRMNKLIVCFYRFWIFVECQNFQIITGAKLRTFGDRYSLKDMFVLYLRNFLSQIIVCADFFLFYDLGGPGCNLVMPRSCRGCCLTQPDFKKSFINPIFAFCKLFQQLWRSIE